MEKNSSSFQIILAAVVVTGTLYLLHRLTTKPVNQYRAQTAFNPAFSVSVDQKNRNYDDIQAVEFVERPYCGFPEEMLQEFSDYGHARQVWPGMGANPGYVMN